MKAFALSVMSPSLLASVAGMGGVVIEAMKRL
jgi:hypothetical protein